MKIVNYANACHKNKGNTHDEIKLKSRSEFYYFLVIELQELTFFLSAYAE
jgi:hypothetical protein